MVIKLHERIIVDHVPCPGIQLYIHIREMLHVWFHEFLFVYVPFFLILTSL